jgi:hypothetical protein
MAAGGREMDGKKEGGRKEKNSENRECILEGKGFRGDRAAAGGKHSFIVIQKLYWRTRHGDAHL